MTTPGSHHPSGAAPSGWRFLHVLALAWACAATVQAQPGPAKPAPVETSGPTWSSLTPQQRSVLAPLQNDWSSIDAPRKAKWLDLAARYPKMSPGEQERIQARMSQWSRMSPQQRAQARLNYQQAKQLPRQERQDQWQSYQALTESERKALAGRAKASGSTDAPAAKPPPEQSSKRNIVANPSHSATQVKPVAPTVVQAAPGATTNLVTRQPTPPAHQQAGMPKIAATPGFVDGNTLLPQRGPQGASVRNPASSPPSKP